MNNFPSLLTPRSAGRVPNNRASMDRARHPQVTSAGTCGEASSPGDGHASARGWNPFVAYPAGLLLLVFAGSHFLMAIVPSYAQESINSVLPFLTERRFSVVAGLFELATALTCLRCARKSVAPVAVCVFIVVVSWYRWALAFTGASSGCHCLGLLGKALHLTKVQEHYAPIIVLVLLTLSVLPWAGGVLRGLLPSRSRLTPIIPLVVAFACSVQLCSADDTVRIAGYYDTSRYNYETGAAFPDLTSHVAFACTFSGPEWSIFCTNTATEGRTLKTPWEGLVYDGNSIYTFKPEDLQDYSPDYRGMRGTNYSVRATISPSPFFVRDFDEFLDFESIWFVYGLRADNLPTNKDGVVEIPLPWYNARTSPMAYGFEWQVAPATDGAFISGCRVVSRAELQQNTREELARPTVVPPEGLGQYNRFDYLRRLRTSAFPEGFVSAVYHCTGWYKTNTFILPMAGEEERYGNYPCTNFPAYKASIRATTVTLEPGLRDLLPRFAQRVIVADYRYHQREGSHVLPYLEYSVSAGEPWRSSRDPGLLAQLKSDMNLALPLYARGAGRTAFVWAILAVILAAPIILVRIAKVKHKTNTNK